MKPASFGIVFAMLFLSLSTISDFRTRALQETGLQRIMYNNCVDSAIEDAITEIVEVDEGQGIQLNKEAAVEDFFTALAVNFGAMENPRQKNFLKACVPAAAFVEREKITFFYGFLEGMEKKEVYFLKEIGDYQIYFSLTDYVVVEAVKSGERLEGDFHDIGTVFRHRIFLEEELFYEEQRRTVRQAFIENMKEIMKKHNETARRLGIEYDFFLPEIREEEWYRGIDGISMIVFFQGYPYGNYTAGYYNRTAIGGAEIKKGERWEADEADKDKKASGRAFNSSLFVRKPEGASSMPGGSGTETGDDR